MSLTQTQKQDLLIAIQLMQRALDQAAKDVAAGDVYSALTCFEGMRDVVRDATQKLGFAAEQEQRLAFEAQKKAEEEQRAKAEAEERAREREREEAARLERERELAGRTEVIQ